MIRFPPQRILVPFDFTDVSMAAWHQARQWARRFKAKLDVVYVEDLIPVPAWEFRPTRLGPEMRDEIVKHIRSKIGDHVPIHVTQGDPVINILRLARTLRAHLIVMGTHGRTGFQRFWAGSVSEAVARMSPVPVLVDHAEPSPIRSVLAPVNFMDYSQQALLYAAGAAAALHAPLTVMHAVSDPLRCPDPRGRIEEAIQRLPADVRKLCRPSVEVARGEATEAILRVGRRHGLVVLSAHRRPLLQDLVMGMTSERVLRYSRVPVACVPVLKSAFVWPKWVPELQGPPLVAP